MQQPFGALDARVVSFLVYAQLLPLLRLAPLEPPGRPGGDEFFETIEQSLRLFFHNEERAVLRLEKSLIDRVI